MENSEFEKNMQQQFEGFKFTPAPEVWNRVEAALPEERKRRRWLLLLLFFAAIPAGILFVWTSIKNDSRQIAGTKKTGAKNTVRPTETKKNTSPAATVSVQLKEAIFKQEVVKKEKPAISSRIKSTVYNPANNQNDLYNDGGYQTPKTIKSKDRLKIAVKPATAVTTTTGEFEKDHEDNVTSDAITKLVTDLAREKDSMLTVAISKIDSSYKTDTIKTAVAFAGKKKENKKWNYGIYAAAGGFNTSNKLFGPGAAYPVAAAVNNNSGSGSVNPPGQGPKSPRMAAAFGMGIYASKKINTRWNFTTGLNYTYQSNTLKTGKRIDSSITVGFGSGRVIANGYYQTGNTISYKNVFHVLELPLLFQYGFGKKHSFYAEGGTTLSYLLSSSALVYSNSAAAYINNAAAFNKLNALVHAGAGIHLAQHSKMPFNMGFQFGYSIAAITKTAFGDQHTKSCFLYVRIPLKK
jgi:Outer membrane protein beta-barrel domain